MVVFHLILGLCAGLVGFFLVLGFGASFWWALLAYSVIGAAALLGSAFVVLALDEHRARGRIGGGPVADAGPLATASPPETDAAEMRILAVDDDPFILELIPRIAATAGFPTVTIAASGEVALDLILSAARPFDCLLLDINMPGMDGIELCGQVRALPAYRDTPIIMLTAMTDLDHLGRAFRAGASDYATKPFDIVEFGNRLQIARARNAARRAGPVSSDSERIASLAALPALIEPAALESYMSRLSGPALTGAYAMALGFGPAAVGQEGALSLPDLIRAARAIDGVFGLTRYVMAHRGGGWFVLVADGALTPDVPAVQTGLRERLQGQGQGEAPIAILVGPAVRLHGGRADRARLTCDTAMALARARLPRAEGDPRPDIANGGPWTGR